LLLLDLRYHSLTLVDPEQFTVIPVPLKIIKLLIDELLSASGQSRAADAAAAAELAEEDSDDGEWEDEPNVFDLSGMASKQGKNLL
jgi:hypothetical protein